MVIGLYTTGCYHETNNPLSPLLPTGTAFILGAEYHHGARTHPPRGARRVRPRAGLSADGQHDLSLYLHRCPRQLPPKRQQHAAPAPHQRSEHGDRAHRPPRGERQSDLRLPSQGVTNPPKRGTGEGS